MKKIQRLLAALLVFCLAAGLLVACTPAEDGTTTTTTEGNTKDTYVITVILEDTQAPVEGIRINLCDDSSCYAPAATDENGKVAYTGMPGYGVYDIHITYESDIPEGYEYEMVQTSADVHEYTLVLKKKSECQHIYVGEYCALCGVAKTYTWTVKVVYQYQGDPIYDETTGELVGYESTDATPVADESLRGQPIVGVSMYILSADGGSMIASGTTDENGEVSFVAPMDLAENGITSYKIYLRDGIPEGYTTTMSGWSFVASSTFCTVTVWDDANEADGTAFSQKKLPLGTTTQITLTEAREDKASTSYDESLYYFCVKPSKQTDVGYYSVTISNIPEGVTVYVGHYASTTTFVSGVANASASGQGTVTLNFNMEEKYMKDSEGNWTYPNSYTFGLRVEGEATYPVTLDVTVTRERDLIPGVDYAITERTYVEIDSNAGPAASILGDVAGKALSTITMEAVRNDEGVAVGYKILVGTEVLAQVDMDEDGNFDVTSALVKDADGYYHIGSADGPMLLLNVCKGNPLLDTEGSQSFLTVNAESGTQTLLYSETVEQKDENGKVVFTTNYVYYYSTMLEAYGQLCGDDGAYPVNDQLLDFLIKWTGQRANASVVGGYGDCAILLGCVVYI